MLILLKSTGQRRKGKPLLSMGLPFFAHTRNNRF